jgi:hypothetical protein
VAVAVDDELKGVLGLVLCNREHIRKTLLHKKEDKLMWSIGSLKMRSQRRLDSGARRL